MTIRVWRTPRSAIYQCDYSYLLKKVAKQGGCDLICTSPPYDDARTYGANVSWKFEDYQKLGDLVFAALKPGGHCLVVLDGPVRKWRKCFGSERSFTPWKVMLDWAERVGFRVPDRLAYGRQGIPGFFKNRFRNDWEPLLWFQDPAKDGFFNGDVLREPAKCGTRKWLFSTKNKDGSSTPKLAKKPFQFKNRGTFWNYGIVGAGHDGPGADAANHPARFTIRLADDIVRCFCPPSGLVVDPFMGSGTTAIAAVRHGMRALGSDFYSRYDHSPWAKIAHERVKKELERLSSASIRG